MNDTVFDYDGQWAKVLKVLDHPLALRALNAGMTSWCDNMAGGDANPRRIWIPEKGAWYYSRGDSWCTEAQYKFEAAGQDEEHNKWCNAQGCPDRDVDSEGCEAWMNSQPAWDQYNAMMKPFYPQFQTVDWYRCYGACHWLAVWNCAIGELLFPKNDWEVMKGEEHSTAFSVRLGLYIDILWGHDHTDHQIWSSVTDNGVSQCTSLMEELEWLETRPYQKEALCTF